MGGLDDPHAVLDVASEGVGRHDEEVVGHGVGPEARGAVLVREGLGDEGAPRGDSDGGEGVGEDAGYQHRPVGREAEYEGRDEAEEGAEEDDLPPPVPVGEHAAWELQEEVAEGLEGGEGPEDPLGGPQLEEVEPPEGAPEEHREHAEALGQGDDHQVPVGQYGPEGPPEGQHPHHHPRVFRETLPIGGG